MTDPAADRDPDAAPDGVTGEIVATLYGLVDALSAHFDRSATTFGLKPTQALALRHLDQPQSMGELATLLHCERSNVTALGDRLELLGLVRRSAVAGDRRVIRLELTDAGRRVRAEFTARLFAGVPAVAGLDEQQRHHFRDLLRQVSAAAADVDSDNTSGGDRVGD